MNQDGEHVTEFAFCPVKEGLEQEFIDVVNDSVPIFRQAKGCMGMRCYRIIGKKPVVIFQVSWEEVDDHRVTFRQSDDFRLFNERISRFLGGEVTMDYAKVAVAGF